MLSSAKGISCGPHLHARGAEIIGERFSVFAKLRGRYGFLEDAGSAWSSLPGLNRTAFLGGIFTCWPVRGFLPMPVFRGLTLKTPNRRNSIRRPLPSATFIASNTLSTACSALLRGMLVFATMAFTMSSLITATSRSAEHHARQGFASCQAALRASRICAESLPVILSPMFAHLPGG